MLSWSTCPGPLALTIFMFSLSECSPSLKCRDWSIDVSKWYGHPIANCSLHFDQLLILFLNSFMFLCGRKWSASEIPDSVSKAKHQEFRWQWPSHMVHITRLCSEYHLSDHICNNWLQFLLTEVKSGGYTKLGCSLFCFLGKFSLVKSSHCKQFVI